METFSSYGEWQDAVANLGADKVLEEYETVGYPAYKYAAGKGNSKVFGHWMSDHGHVYSTGMNFRTTSRKFKAVWINKINTDNDTIRVEGSKGNIYEVQRDGEYCTCPGYTFSKKWPKFCKHTTAVKEGKL